MGGMRDINDIFGYSTSRTFLDYFRAYRFGDVAKLIIDLPAKSCWRGDIRIVDKDNKELIEDQMRILKKIKFFQKLERADILNRIGRFSVLYVMVPDGMDPHQPLATSSPDQLERVSFAPYSEDGITITAWDTEPTSQRFGLPTMYNLQVISRGEKEQTDVRGAVQVHWTRIIHMAEGALDSDVEGMPTLENLLNRLVDLNKVVGGSAEAYFRNARQKLALESDPKFAVKMDDETKAALKTEADKFQNNWTDILKLSGLKANMLQVTHADPEGSFNTIIRLLAGAAGIPIRVLLGIGVGQLSGAEDKASYAERITERRESDCEGWLWRGLEILANAKMLDDVFLEGEVDWPEVSASTEAEEADIAVKKAQALALTSNALGPVGGLADEVTAEQAIEDILGMEYKPDTAALDDDAEMEEEAARMAAEGAE